MCPCMHIKILGPPKIRVEFLDFIGFIMHVLGVQQDMVRRKTTLQCKVSELVDITRWILVDKQQKNSPRVLTHPLGSLCWSLPHILVCIFCFCIVLCARLFYFYIQTLSNEGWDFLGWEADQYQDYQDLDQYRDSGLQDWDFDNKVPRCPKTKYPVSGTPSLI